MTSYIVAAPGPTGLRCMARIRLSELINQILCQVGGKFCCSSKLVVLCIGSEPEINPLLSRHRPRLFSMCPGSSKKIADGRHLALRGKPRLNHQSRMVPPHIVY